MISVKSAREVQLMKESNRIVAVVLDEIGSLIKVDLSTKELDRIAEKIILSEGGIPGFKNYSVPGLPPFPAALCTSVNSCIAHGIPSDDVVLKDGDIVGIDVGVIKDGYCGDGAGTYAVGNISDKAKDLMNITRQALEEGIAEALPGNRVGDISHAIGSFVISNGYYVADNLTGHGIGRLIHEEPVVPNFGRKHRGNRLKEGMTIAIEPMVNIGTNRVFEDGWEYYVADGSLSAHFEHTILITDGKPEILTRSRQDYGKNRSN
ncbi:MAG: type I methionyl aminopeptidase [Candidatus Cloacimonadota bacterium]|nr:MAG: type I methionyl aminopeptidase [Candidatus Cloacimonadota bacterium]